MANIKDLARSTGLSTATVSRYLNGHPYVSKEAQYAIELAIRELGYSPNAAARSLRSGKTGRIAIVVLDASHPFYSALVAGAAGAAVEYGYDLLVQQTCTKHWNPDRVLQPVVTRAIDALIVATELEPWGEYAAELERFRVVTCDQALSQAGLHGLYIDHYQSTLDGLEHLYERGARVIACLHDPDHDRCSSSRIRVSAYEQFASRYSEMRIVQLEAEDDTVETGASLLQRIGSEFPEVDGVFSGSDDLAAGLLLAAREAGLDVPGRLRILGFDDQPLARVLGLSTIRQPVRKMGARAVHEVHRLIQQNASCGRGRPNGRRHAPDKIRVPYRLMIRSTT